ncbi:MAG: HIT family protein [Verrucomicrobiota bacterium]|jgi:histidine triad (HIT) family protein|nr:HIT family protein [Verrucomicrobiota bacterium]
MTDANCIFCKIIAGEIPAYAVYEDEHALAFLDIAPFERGHVLVVSKHHAAYLTELPPDALAGLTAAAQTVAARLLKNLGCDGFNLLQNNGACATQTVPHVHIHIVPRWNGRPVNWIPGAYDSPAADLAGLQQKIKAP